MSKLLDLAKQGIVFQPLDEEKPQEEDGNFVRGFKKAMVQIPETAGGAIGLAGDAIGSEAVKKYGMDIYDKYHAQSEALTRPTDSASHVIENGGEGTGAFLASGAGYVVGQAASAVATGGVGGFIGSQLAKRGIREVVARGAESAIAKDVAGKVAANGAKVGAGAALFGSNLTQEAGSIYPEAVEEAKRDGRGGELSGADLARVGVSALGAAAVDTAAQASIFKNIAKGGRRVITDPKTGELVSEGIGRAALREIPGGMVKEAATEGVQTGIERFGAQQDLTTADAIRDYVDSMALGALGGGLGGGASVLHAQKVPESGMLSRAANANIDEQILQLQHDPQPLISFPDGSVGHKQDLAAYLTQFTDPEERQAKEREIMGRDPKTGKRVAPEPEPEAEQTFETDPEKAKSVYESWSSKHDPLPLDMAQRYLKAPGAKGMSLMVVPHAEGAGYTVIPSKWLPLEEQVKYADLQAPAKEGGKKDAATSKPAGEFSKVDELSELVRAEKDDLERRRQDYITKESLRRESELEAIGGRVEAGNMERTRHARFSVLDEVLSDPKLATVEDRKRKFAAELRRAGYTNTRLKPDELAHLDRHDAITAAFETVEQEPSAPNELDPALVKEKKPKPSNGIILNPKGAPFKSEFAAKKRLKDAKLNGSHEIAAVDGGFVLQPKKATDSFNQAAHEAATSPKNDLPEPSQAQKEAGNYKKGHVSLHGLDIAIENPQGSVRKGVDRDGKAWENTLAHHYGYIKGTVGADKDHIDTFINGNGDSDRVFVVDQVHPDTGKFDEHKVVFGANSADEARAIYQANYAKDWQGGKDVSETDVAGFKAWLKEGDTKKPFKRQAATNPAPGTPAPAAVPPAPAPAQSANPAQPAAPSAPPAADLPDPGNAATPANTAPATDQAIASSDSASKAPAVDKDATVTASERESSDLAQAVDIKKAAGKQIPGMTDAELLALKDHYAEDHPRRAKIVKAIETRGLKPAAGNDAITPGVKMDIPAKGETQQEPAKSKVLAERDAKVAAKKQAVKPQPAPADVAPAPTHEPNRAKSEPKDEPKAKKPSSGAQVARDRLKAENPFLAFIASEGVSILDKADIGMDRGRFGNRLIPGYGPVFRNNGTRIDQLALRALEDGFLTQDDIDNPGDTGGTNKLADMIRRAVVDKEIILPPASIDDGAEAQARQMQDDALLAEAHNVGIETTGKSMDQVYDDVVAYHAAADASLMTYDVLNALLRNASEIQRDHVDADLDAAFDAPVSTYLTDEQLDEIFGSATQQESTRGAEEGAGTNAPGRAEEDRAEPGNFDLAGETEAEARAEIAERERRAKEAKAAQEDADRKAQADADRDDFNLTGSDRDADVAAAQGQQDIFVQPEAKEQPAQAATEKTAKEIILDIAKSRPFDDFDSVRADAIAAIKEQTGKAWSEHDDLRGNMMREPLAETIHAGQYEGMRAHAATLPVRISESAIPMSAAVQAFTGTSFSPEERGASVRRTYFREVMDLWKRFEKAYQAAPADRQAAFVDAFNVMASQYAGMTNAYLSAHSRVMSSMIAGPARFPAESNRKKSDTADRRASEANDFLNKAPKRLMKVLRGAVDNSLASQIKEAESKLAAREKTQEEFKAVNAALRKNNDQVLRDMGLSDAAIADYKKPDFAGRTGIADYRLKNNNAEIRRLRERVEELNRRAAEADAIEETDEAEPEAGADPRMVRNAEANRLQLFFDGKPEEAIRTKLKAAGFRWSPSNGAWQRQLTDNAVRAAEQIVKEASQRNQPNEEDNGAQFFKRDAVIEQAIRDGVLPEALTGEPATFDPAQKPMTVLERRQALQDVAALNKALVAAGEEPVSLLAEAPTPQHALAQQVAKVFGAKVRFVSKSDAFEGVAYRGVAYLKEGMRRPELAIAGHEVFHTLEQSNPALAENLLGHVRGYLREHVVQDRQMRESLMAGKAVSERYAEGEVLADLNGAMWLDPKFWQELRQRDESLFRRVAYLFMEAATKAVQSLTGTRFDAAALVTDVNSVRALIAQAWAEHNKGRDTALHRDQSAASQTRFSREDIGVSLKELVDLAETDANENRIVEIAPVSSADAALMKREGLSVDDTFTHTVDLYAIRHANRKHGDEKAEKARGQLAVTTEEIQRIPDIVSSPDAFILGARNKIGRDLIGYVKMLPDGTTLYLEEVRTGRRRLAMTSMRRYPAAKNASEAIQTVLLNVRNDGGNVRIVYPESSNSQDGGREAASARGSENLIGDGPGTSPLQPASEANSNIAQKNGDSDIKFSRGEKADSPAFRRWFGGSKVVDENGEPLVVYHGTRQDFNSFAPETGWFTSNPGEANVFGGQNGEGANVIPAYVSIQKPRIIDGETTSNWRSAIFDALTDGSVDGVIVTANGKPAWVVPVEPTQIKSATGNNGDYDPNNADIRFSRTGDAMDMLRSAKTFSDITKNLQSIASSDRTFNLWDRTIGTQFHKSTKDADFKRVFDAFNQQTDDTAHYAIEAERFAPNVLQRLDNFKDIGKALVNSGAKQKADIEAVSKALFANIAGVKGVAQKVFMDHELRSEFKLTDNQILMYRQVRKAVDTSIDRLAQTTIAAMGEAAGMDIRALKNLDLDATAKAVKDGTEDGRIGKNIGGLTTDEGLHERIDQLVEHAQFLKDAGYMPAMRFGQFAVTVTDPKKKGDPLHFEMFESQITANIAANRLAKEYPGMQVVKAVMNPDQYAMFKGVSPETVELFAKFSGMDENEAFKDYIALAKSGRSTMKRMLERKGIAGFSDDATRVLASFITSNARQSALNMNGGEVNAAMSSESLARKGDVQREAQKLHEYMSNPKEEAQKLRGFLFMQFLGGSVASAVTNLTQPILQTTPYLSQYAGAKTTSIMAAAARMAATGNIDNQELREAMDRARADGITEPHEIHMLMADASGSLLGGSLKARALTKAWGSFFSLSEAFNRRVTFLAAYQTAMQMGQQKLEAKGFKDAYQFAQRAIIETQGLYSKTNRPNWARGAVGATLFTFKQFSISLVEMFGRLPPKQKVLMLGIMMLAAGIQGLPFADDLEDLIDTLGQTMGYSTNSKKALRQALTAAFGKDVGEILNSGLSAKTGIDMSGRLGAGNLIPGTGLFKMSEKDKSRDVAEFAGPMGSVLTSFQQAFTKVQAGNVFGRTGALATMAPTAVKNALQGAEMANRGVFEDTKGRRVQDVDVIDALVKGLGFQPQQIATETRKISDMMQDKGMRDAVRSAVVERIVHGTAEKDQEAVRRARETLLEWNRKNPEQKITISPTSIRSRLMEMRKTREERFLKSVPKAQRGGAREELQE